MYMCEKRHKDMNYFLSSIILVRFFMGKVRFFSFLHKKPIKTHLFLSFSDILKREQFKTRKMRQTICRTFLC